MMNVQFVSRSWLSALLVLSSTATWSQEYQPKFSLVGKARGVYFADRYQMPDDSTTMPRAHSGHVMADLGMRLVPNAQTEVLAMVRVRNDYGGFWGSGVTFDLRQLQVKGLIQDRIRYTLGDVDYALTPFTFHRPGPLMAGILPSTMAHMQQTLAGYDAFTTGYNTWRQQGGTVEFRTGFKRGPEHADQSLFAFRQRAGFGGQATESWAFGGSSRWKWNNFLNRSASSIYTGVNVVSIRDIAGSSNATDLYGNTVITGSGQIPLHRNLSFSFEAGGSQTQWLSGDQDADYMLHAKLGYFKGHMDKGISVHTLTYTEVGPDFYSPAAQTTPNISGLAPAAFTRIGNEKSIREWTYLDLFRESNLYKFRWNTSLGSDNNTYLIMDPRGIATQNRRTLEGQSAVDVWKGGRLVSSAAWAQEIRGQGTTKLTQFSRIDVALHQRVDVGHGAKFHARYRDQRAWRINVGDDVPDTRYSLPWWIFGAEYTLTKDARFTLHAEYLQLAHSGFAFDILRNAENQVTDIQGGERSHMERIPSLSLKYTASENSDLTMGWLGSFVKTLDNQYSIQNLYVLYAISF